MKIRALLVLTLLSLVCCEGSLELLLSSYQNPSHQLYNGRCCDSLSTTLCHLDPCDNALTLCLLPRQTHTTTGSYLKERSFERLVCPAGWNTVELGLVSMDSDNVSFPGERGWINERKRLSNPITLSGDQWKDGFKLLVLVADFDSRVRELVNVLAADWDPLVTSNEFPSPRLVKSMGRGDVTLALSARVRNSKQQKKKPLKNKFGATSEPPTILETPSVDSSPLNTQSLTTQLPTTVQATQETTMLYTEGVTTQGVATQAMPGVTTQAMQGATAQKVGGELSLKENVRGVLKSGSVMTVGATVGGVLGTVSVIVLSLLVVVLCLHCLKKKQREDRLMLTGNSDSEVAALRTGPLENPNYTDVSPNTNSQSGYGFNNSLYGALSQGGLSHDTHMTPPPPPQEPIHSQYSKISRELMESDSLVDSGSYSQVTEQPLPAGYSVVSREHMEEDEYCVITREDLTDGYNVVTREHLEEASDSEEEESHDSSTSKLLSGH